MQSAKSNTGGSLVDLKLGIVDWCGQEKNGDLTSYEKEKVYVSDIKVGMASDSEK